MCKLVICVSGRPSIWYDVCYWVCVCEPLSDGSNAILYWRITFSQLNRYQYVYTNTFNRIIFSLVQLHWYLKLLKKSFDLANGITYIASAWKKKIFISLTSLESLQSHPKTNDDSSRDELPKPKRSSHLNFMVFLTFDKWIIFIIIMTLCILVLLLVFFVLQLLAVMRSYIRTVSPWSTRLPLTNECT